MLNKRLEQVLDFIWPRDLSCVNCSRSLYEGHTYHLCKRCLASFQWNTGKVCKICGRMIRTDYPVCDNCKQLDRFIDAGTSVVTYDEVVKHILFNYKYFKHQYIGHSLALMIKAYLIKHDLELAMDAITYVPLHKSRLKKRGFNQAKQLAEFLGDWFHIPVIDPLKRIKNTPPLNPLNPLERQAILKDAFSCEDHVPEHILLVDDIFTTGTTLNLCSRHLKEKGCLYVHVLTFAVGE